MTTMLEGLTTYLAHPIDFAGRCDLPRWRLVQKVLENYGALVFDPMRALNTRNLTPHAGALRICRAAIDACDAVVAVDPEKPGVGTAMELQYALERGKPAVVITEATGSWALAGSGAAVFSTFELPACDSLLSQLVAQQRGRLWDNRIVWSRHGKEGRSPSRGYPGDAGWDLYVSESVLINPGETRDVLCGIRVALPEGTFGLVIGRSSTMRTHKLHVHINVIDGGYRGPMFAQVENQGTNVYETKIGQRLAQLVPLPNLAGTMADPVQLHELDFADLATDRGQAGFGSSGE